MMIKNTRMLLLAWLLALLALAGCGSSGMGGSQGDNGSDATGELRVALTDAPGDFTAYDVKVVEVTLTRANGNQVSALPASARVDFSQLTQTTELVATGVLPLGEYTGVGLTLDYTDAQIYVERDGAPVRAVAVDGLGAPLGLVKMDVTLTGDGRFTVSRGCLKDITLDFNLAATNTVDLAPVVPVVTVTPFLVAEIDRASHKTMAIRGPLVSADPSGTFFTMGVKPRMADRNHGVIEVDVDDLTEYLVDGQAARGSAGFALLAAKGTGTAVVAEGSTKPGPSASAKGTMGPGMDKMNNGNNAGAAPAERRAFVASRVRAGSSVVGGTLDALHGTVISRQGNLLTVAGSALDRSGNAVYGANTTLSVSDGTRVSKEGDDASTISADEISVGQKLSALGVYDALTHTLDATGGSVRLLATRTAGTIVSLSEPDLEADGGVTLSLVRLGGVNPGEMTFSGTGATPDDDSDPSAYAVNTSTLELGGLFTGDPLIAIGFPAAFGHAGPDFDALALVDLSAEDAELRMNWDTLQPSPITAIGSSSLTLYTTGAGTSAIKFGGVHFPLPAGVQVDVVPAQPAKGPFAIIRGRNVETYADFPTFATALKSRLDAGQGVASFVGEGAYDSALQLFDADRLAVRLKL